MFENNLTYEESEISESLANEKSFRISVRLQKYFEDVRARSYILVARKGSVQCLEKRIQKIFNLPGSFCLCTNGHLLPSSESLALLNPGDIIEVVPLDEAHEISCTAANVKNKQRHLQGDVGVRDSQILNVSKCISPIFVANNQKAILNEADRNVSTRFEEKTGVSENKNGENVNIAGIEKHKIAHKENSQKKIGSKDFDCDENCYYDTKEAYSLYKRKRQALTLLEKHCSVFDAMDGPDTADARHDPDARDALDMQVTEEPTSRRARRRVRRRARRRTPGPDSRTEPGRDLLLDKYPESEKNQELEKYPESEKDLDSEKPTDLEVEPNSGRSPSLSLSVRVQETEPCLSMNVISQCESDVADALALPCARVNSDVTRNGEARARPPRLVRALPD